MNNKIESVKKFIIKVINEEIKYIKPNSTIEVTNIKNINLSHIYCQFYINERMGKIYLFYDLDYKITQNIDKIYLYKRINSRLIMNSKISEGLYIEILGPSTYFYPERRQKGVSVGNILRPTVTTYWYCDFDDTFKFIEDPQEVDLDNNKILLNHLYDYQKILKDFRNKVKELNYKYRLYSVPYIWLDEGSMETIPELQLNSGTLTSTINKTISFNAGGVRLDYTKVKDIWKEYSKYYYELYNRNIKPIDDNDIYKFYIYIN